MTGRAAEGSHTECADCSLPPTRRTFLRDVSLAAAGALLAAGMPERLVATMTPAAVRPLRQGQSDPTYPIPAEDGVQIDKDNMVILVRWQNVVIACSLACPHQRTVLEWGPDKKEFECPKHHSRFQPTGVLIEGRAKRSMDRYDVARTDNSVVVHLDKLYREDENLEPWTKAVISLA